jgi:hypothetical protein
MSGLGSISGFPQGMLYQLRPIVWELVFIDVSFEHEYDLLFLMSTLIVCFL